MSEEIKPIEVSRRIEAPAAAIFEVLADPQRHRDFDGSGMLQGAVLDRPISDVGDTFTMKMHRLGDDYLMLNYVVEFEPDRRIFWEPEDLLSDGGTWINGNNSMLESMTASLERLEKIVTK
jgi:hypothetical protein